MYMKLKDHDKMKLRINLVQQLFKLKFSALLTIYHQNIKSRLIKLIACIDKW